MCMIGVWVLSMNKYKQIHKVSLYTVVNTAVNYVPRCVIQYKCLAMEIKINSSLCINVFHCMFFAIRFMRRVRSSSLCSLRVSTATFDFWAIKYVRDATESWCNQKFIWVHGEGFLPSRLSVSFLTVAWTGQLWVKIVLNEMS